MKKPINPTELLILKNLTQNDKYGREVFSFFQELTRNFPKHEWLDHEAARVLFQITQDFFLKYNKFPSKEALVIEVKERDDLLESVYEDSIDLIQEIFKEECIYDLQWLKDETEKYCKNRAVFLTLMQCVEISKNKHDVNAIPSMWQKTLAISLDTSVGHDYIEDYEERWAASRLKEEKVTSDIDTINKITNGGFSKKTLSCIMGASGKGKSIWLCHTAAAALSMGYNVVYITLELSDKKVGERIDANLLNLSVQDLRKLPEVVYKSKMEDLKKSVRGKLVIKEYPTSVANVNHFNSLLNELKTKKNFIPDLIIVDYLNICTSARIKSTGSGSYERVKACAEELRCMAFQYNAAVITATQYNREGAKSTDPEMEGVSDSYGLPYTLDLFLAFTTSDRLDQENLIQVKQLKNRDNDDSTLKRFLLKMDKPKMQVSDLPASLKDKYKLSDPGKGFEESEEEEIIDTTPNIKTLSKMRGDIKQSDIVRKWVTE